MIRDSHADILFVGFSSPTKEQFLNRWMPAMEPRRMWKRYATTNTVFVWMVMKDYYKKKWK